MDIVYDYSDLNSNLFTLQYGKDCPDHLKLMDQFLQRIAIYEDGTVKVKFNTIRHEFFFFMHPDNAPKIETLQALTDEQVAEQLIKQLVPLTIQDLDVFGEPAAQTVIDIESSTYEIEDEEITLIYKAKTVTKTFINGKKDS